jgi:biopolymer transport protein ExbB
MPTLQKLLLELYLQGGPILLMLLMCSFIAWALAINCFLQIRLKVKGGFEFGKDIVIHIQQGDHDSAINLCKSYSNILSIVLLKIIPLYKHIHHNTLHCTKVSLNNEVTHISQRLPLLAGLGAVCPLLGLLGTVSGITDSFSTISIGNVNNMGQLSSGISEALITTQAGFIAGIPIIIIHQYLSVKLRKQTTIAQYYLQQITMALKANNI